MGNAETAERAESVLKEGGSLDLPGGEGRRLMASGGSPAHVVR